jgi:hypothetical protein
MTERRQIMSEFVGGILASLGTESRDGRKSVHWLAGWDAGYEMRLERNRRLDEYLVSIGVDPQAVVHAARKGGAQ